MLKDFSTYYIQNYDLFVVQMPTCLCNDVNIANNYCVLLVVLLFAFLYLVVMAELEDLKWFNCFLPCKLAQLNL
jgi:hypothetical protein